MLIGTSTQPGAFTEQIVTAMASHAERPVIMPLSNPTSHSEAQAADLIAWTGGRALIATGSPFAPVPYDGVEYQVAQANNALIFPGLGLGVTVSRARRVSDGMLVAAADALAWPGRRHRPGRGRAAPGHQPAGGVRRGRRGCRPDGPGRGPVRRAPRRPGRTGPGGHVGAGLPRGGGGLTMPWSVRAVPLPDGDRPADLWIDATGCVSAGPVPDAEPLPGRYVAPGLVDAHAHPCVGPGPVARNHAETLDELTAWAASGVCPGPRHRIAGGLGAAAGSWPRADRACRPPGGSSPRRDAISRPCCPRRCRQQRLTELALAELARGARWVKVIADFPPVVDGTPSGPAGPTYSLEAVEAMTAAVHAAGGRVAAHVATDAVAQLVRAGVDSVEHGTALDESTLRLMAQAGTAWTPTLCAVLAVPGTAPEKVRRRVAEYRERLGELLPLAHRLGVPVLTGTDISGHPPSARWRCWPSTGCRLPPPSRPRPPPGTASSASPPASPAARRRW